jgi:hypothetical protein
MIRALDGGGAITLVRARHELVRNRNVPMRGGVREINLPDQMALQQFRRSQP